jgi:hypothetical protein
MQVKSRGTWRLTAAVLTWGFLGGVSLIAMLRFASPSARPALTYGIFGTLVLESSVTFRHAGGPGRRFAWGLATFMAATLIVYAYTILVVNPRAMTEPLWEHVWRLGFMLGLGALATSVPLAIGAAIGLFRGGPRGSMGSHIQPRASDRSVKAKAPSSHLQSAVVT